MPMKEFLMSLPPKTYRDVQIWAGKRGVSIQEFLRNVVIPEWIADKAKSGDFAE